jgi:hypothetical protein
LGCSLTDYFGSWGDWGFDFHENDLGSEESLWDLYERWRSHHTVISKSLDEKHKRFNVFKENVTHVHTTNRMDKPYKLKMNKLADMTKWLTMSLGALTQVGPRLSTAGCSKEHHVEVGASCTRRWTEFPTLLTGGRKVMWPVLRTKAIVVRRV